MRILLFLLLLGCSSATIVVHSEDITKKSVNYTCDDACKNYKEHKCTSAIDDSGYSCTDVCWFFTESIGTVSQEQLNCLSVKDTCKKIFACVGY